ncbi:protease modulator HflC [Gymnodinialimonas hymeniacidonis]|uniref:protease modulator HflC n=1 Tax=Gymnodinialimonas hymeniacidonis TaxID=3126508 RepID=UPI0034C5B3D7
MSRITYLIPVIVLGIVVISSSIFVVDERQRALVLQFGQIRQVINEPGLNFKIPFIQNVEYFEDRILSLDTEPTQVTPSDDRRLVVSAFARYRIDDVEEFVQAVPGGVRQAEDLLDGILRAQIRSVLGADGVTSNTILSQDRAGLMRQITTQARSDADGFGITVLDVRLQQTDLPEQNLDATFARMRAEREREAADEIARGEEAAQRIRAQADRTVVELVSEANREAEITRGEADAERTRIFAEAFGQDAEFYDFTRSLAAYETALRENSTFVISPDSEFFEYFDGSALGGGNSLAAPSE